MTESSGGPGGSGPPDADQVTVPAHPPAEAPPPHLPTEVASQNLPTEMIPHPETEIAAPHAQTEVAAPHLPTEVASQNLPTEVMPHPETEIAGRGSGVAAQDGRTAGPGVSGGQPAAGQVAGSGRPAGIVRHGPGVPVSALPGQAAVTAGKVWRTGRLPEPPRRRRRLRRVASGALTVILLAAAGVVLFLRFHHASFRVTGVAITRQVANGCAVDVTGRIATDGSAGTVSYQWLFAPQSQAPQPVSQSVVAGQDAVSVTVALEGQGHGSVSRDVTLQVLSPGTGTASVHVVVSC